MKAKVKVINLKVPLYDFNEDEEVVPMSDEECDQIFDELSEVDDINGYAIRDITMTEEEMTF